MEQCGTQYSKNIASIWLAQARCFCSRGKWSKPCHVSTNLFGIFAGFLSSRFAKVFGNIDWQASCQAAKSKGATCRAWQLYGLSVLSERDKHTSPRTPHSTLHTSYFPHRTPQSTRHTSHSTRHTSYPLLPSSHFKLHTQHFTAHTPHFTPHTLVAHPRDTASKSIRDPRDTPRLSATSSHTCHTKCNFATSTTSRFVAIPIGTARGWFEPRDTQQAANRAPPRPPTKKTRTLRSAFGKKQNNRAKHKAFRGQQCSLLNWQRGSLTKSTKILRTLHAKHRGNTLWLGMFEE